MTNDNTLQHWGIKGMKWGVRRYQHKDGTLTALGRKRMKEMDNKLRNADKQIKDLQKENEELRKTSQSSQTASVSKLKKVSEMNDDELRERVNRLNMEKQYKQYVSELYPETKTAGQKFVDKVVKDVLVPSAVEVGKNLAKNMMTNALDSMVKSGNNKNNQNNQNNQKKHKNNP